jgi:hypothetical protein
VELGAIEDRETLKQAVELLERENKRLLKIVLELRSEVRELRGGEPQQLALQIAELEEQLAKRDRLLFGESSEKRPKERAPKPASEPRRGHGPREQLELPTIEQVHRLDAADRACPKCGGICRSGRASTKKAKRSTYSSACSCS